jgi:glycosyltransferase involved in cell wall biosynthesis
MGRKETILFVNRWRGTIGPNVGLKQMVGGCLRRGHEVHIASPWRDDCLEGLSAAGAHVHRVEGLEFAPHGGCPFSLVRHGIRGVFASGRLARLAREIGASLLVVNGENMLFAPRAGRLAGCPVVVVMQGARFAGLGLAARIFFRLQKRWVNRYLAISQTVAEGLARVGVGRDKVVTIFCGVDAEVFAPRSPDPALAARLGIPPRAQVILAVCNLEPRKGVHHLIESFGLVAGQSPQAICVIVGGPTHPDDEAYAAQLRRRAESLGLSGKVVFTGQRPDVPDLLALADVVAHPSETESFGRAVAEAMAAGKPVVGFRVDAVAELIDDGVTGLLADPFDARDFAAGLLRLLADADLRTQMGQAGRQRVLRLYDLKVNLPATVDLLEHVARQEGGGDNRLPS